jgi:hypothetical protein
MVKFKNISRFVSIILLIAVYAIRFLLHSPDFDDLFFIFDLIVVILLIFPIPIYFFFKYKTFRLHTKTSMHLFGSSQESTLYFLFMYYLLYSFTILAIVFVIVSGLIAGPDLSFSTVILTTSLIYAILSTLFFLTMHRLAAKPDANKNKELEVSYE